MMDRKKRSSAAVVETPSVDKKPRIKETEATRKTTPPSSLVVLTWNVAECRPSDHAPKNLVDTEELIVTEILRHDADVLCLQECPTRCWSPSELLSKYTLAGNTPSHCGYTHLWIKTSRFGSYQAVEFHPTRTSPSVAAVAFLDELPIGLASSHLEPFGEGASLRLDQLRALREAVPTSACIFAGDYNARQAEDTKVEQVLQLQDAWRSRGKPRTVQFTWDSFRNTYHMNGFQFRCRFDRIYFDNDAMQCTDLKCFGNEPVTMDDQSFFLSDHYGLVATFEVLGRGEKKE